MIVKLRGQALPRTVLGALFGLIAACGGALAQGTPAQPGQYQAPPNQANSSATGQNQSAPTSSASNPMCVRLEGQLAALNQGVADPGRADQIKRAEDAIAKQQADLDRTVAQAHKGGCAGEGFFALFSALSPQCGPVTSQIQQMRGNLDHAMSDLEQLKSGNNGQDGQRRALIGQLAQNNCGAQYASAASSGSGGFLDALFGNGTIVNPSGDGAPSGTYRTVCVRSCDGYYFPISYSTVPSRFADDERSCQRLCPAAEVALYSYRNPGETMEQAMSVSGQAYTALPNAFRYRKELSASCSCRRPARAGPMRSRTPTTRPRSSTATSSSPTRTPKPYRKRRNSRANRQSAQRKASQACRLALLPMRRPRSRRQALLVRTPPSVPYARSVRRSCRHRPRRARHRRSISRRRLSYTFAFDELIRQPARYINQILRANRRATCPFRRQTNMCWR